MERELKFRAWLPATKKMTHSHSIIEFSKILSQCDISIDNNIYMQYTGLKDKNGIEIYEGDIVKLHNESEHTKKEYWYPIYTIEWYGVGFRCKYAKKGGKAIDNIAFNFQHYCDEDIEVIGNIYTNPN